MSTPVVTVVGSAELEGPPDLASLSCTVHAVGDSAQAVRTLLAAATQQVTAVLAGLADAVETSGTTGLHVAPVFDRRRATRVDHVEGSVSTQLVVHDFDRLPALVQGLTGIENAQLDGPWWSLRAGNPLHREVRLAAVADARHRADDYAAAFGARVAELLEVSDTAGGPPGPVQLRAFAMSPRGGRDEEEPIDVRPSVQTVSAQVRVRFALTAVDLAALPD